MKKKKAKCCQHCIWQKSFRFSGDCPAEGTSHMRYGCMKDAEPCPISEEAMNRENSASSDEEFEALTKLGPDKLYPHEVEWFEKHETEPTCVCDEFVAIDTTAIEWIDCWHNFVKMVENVMPYRWYDAANGTGYHMRPFDAEIQAALTELWEMRASSRKWL